MPRVLVFGAGAVGGYFGACLVRAGHDVTFVARGSNLETLRRDGVRVTGALGAFDLPVTATDVPAGDVDLTLLCVKNYDLVEACAAIGNRSELVLTLQNGVDAPGVAGDALGDVVLAGTTGIVADLPEPGHVHVVSSYAWIRFGEWDGRGVTDRVERAATLLAVPGIEPIPVPDARVSLWEKMALMCGMAGLTSLHQRPMGEILADPSLRATFFAILGECETVARKRGVVLPDGFVDARLAYADGIDPAAMSSMSRDLVRGRRIELESFNGAIVRMGADLGIEVPTNAALYDGIRAKVS